MYKKLASYVIILFAFLFTAPHVLAVRFDLVPPSGQLYQGQEVTFTINIDTQGATINTIQTGMTYDTVYLEYVSSAAGAAMNSISVDTSQGTGKLVFTGTNTAGFTGTGVFGTVVFKLIAQAPGSTEICTLWVPTPSSTPAVYPTTPPVVPTTPPQPTALPQTGFDIPKNAGTIAGGAFLLASGAIVYYSKKNAYTSSHKKHTHKKST
ncbi:MAG: cohesin domain-containing protein [Patescibacteria group bacterium]